MMCCMWETPVFSVDLRHYRVCPEINTWSVSKLELWNFPKHADVGCSVCALVRPLLAWAKESDNYALTCGRQCVVVTGAWSLCCPEFCMCNMCVLISRWHATFTTMPFECQTTFFIAPVLLITINFLKQKCHLETLLRACFIYNRQAHRVAEMDISVLIETKYSRKTWSCEIAWRC